MLAPKDFVFIEYPAQASKIQMLRSIKASEEAPFAIGIKNVSLKDLGINSTSARLLKASISYQTGQKNVEFLEKYEWDHKLLPDDMRQENEAERLIYQKNLEVLPAGQQVIISGTLRFTDPDLPAYTQTKLSFHLDIGDIRQPGVTIRRIQIL